MKKVNVIFAIYPVKLAKFILKGIPLGRIFIGAVLTLTLGLGTWNLVLGNDLRTRINDFRFKKRITWFLSFLPFTFFFFSWVLEFGTWVLGLVPLRA
ncbi:MAG: hypothetical protein HY958_02175 [Bacteroidia bacterium]|nr:hypothetical protein [Bacteroidia bacterium]